MKLNEINLRDPFVLLFGDKYYMYGSKVEPEGGFHQKSFEVYISDDLTEWSEPKCIFSGNNSFWGKKDFWAPEVHFYKGKFYMFASFKSDTEHRGTAILVSDTPDGRFVPHNNRVTPKAWECLDGTLYIENGVPYTVFCHEWCQIGNGEVCAVQMTDDLTSTVGEPFLLWRAGDAEWICSVTGDGNYVTDGPFLFKTEDNRLKSLWSSFSNGEYVLATATSENGSIRGKWTPDNELIYEKDGGHGMIFTDKNGDRYIAIHTPNRHLEERPIFLSFK